AVFFVIGLISAAYPSADGALTALTASFCIDFLGFGKKDWPESKKKKIRYTVHISFALVLLGLIVFFRAVNDDAVISKLFTIATYTYGPLLGLFAFGLMNKHAVNDRLVPLVCLIAPAASYFINENSVEWFSGYKFGFELIILNGFIAFVGLWFIRRPSSITGFAVDK
ncbi:MAG: sodium:solute symporter, partial [Flavobacteriales bacterium]